MTEDLDRLIAEHRRLVEENTLLKRELEDVRWAAEKTNRGVKHLYRELERQNRDLKKLDLLKSEFISTVSHELRTPLAILREAIAQVADGVHGPMAPGQGLTLGLALRGADRLTRLVTDLLDLSKIESGKVRLRLEPTDLAVCVRDRAEEFRPAISKKKLELEVRTPAALVTYADRDKFDQILTNLISNAVKFTDRGRITVTLEAAGGEAVLIVEDTGIGISEEDLPRVFSKFEQFSRQRSSAEKGAGLGLAISRGLAEMHGGTIDVGSRLGAGSRFEVRLPLRGAKEAVQDLLSRMRDRAFARGLTVGSVTVEVAPPVAAGDPAGRNFCRRLEAVVRDCLRRQEDTMIADGGRVWVLLPEADRQASRAVYDRVRDRVDQFLAKETDGKVAAEYGLTVVEQEQTLPGGQNE